MNRNASINDADVMATPDLLPAIQHARATFGTTTLPRLPSVEAAGGRWVAFDRPLASSRTALLIFEAWNLLVIGLSLAGFNHIPRLVSSSSCTFWGLLLAAIGTVAVTIYCVYAWTRG